jgi:RNA recognition motif-containing protein
MATKLFVGNLPFSATDTDLEAHFAQAGAVASVTLVRERETGRPRGFAFIEMGSQADADAAIRQFNEQPFGGRPLIVNEARPAAPRGGDGFGGGRSRREPRW